MEAASAQLECTPGVSSSPDDMHTCLIDSYRALKWIAKNSPTYKVELAYRELKTLDEQMGFLKPYLQGVSLEIEGKYYKAQTWADVLNYMEEESRLHGNGVLLIWMENVKDFGHAVPIIDSKLEWGTKTCGYDLVMTFGSNFYCRYIFVDTLI